MLFCEVCKERWKVAVANMWIEQQLTKWHGRIFLGQGRMSKQRAGVVVGDRIGNGPAYQIHLADELDAFLCLVIELEHEAEDVARIDEADNNDISRSGILLLKITLPMRVLTDWTAVPSWELLNSSVCQAVGASVQ